MPTGRFISVWQANGHFEHLSEKESMLQVPLPASLAPARFVLLAFIAIAFLFLVTANSAFAQRTRAYCGSGRIWFALDS